MGVSPDTGFGEAMRHRLDGDWDFDGDEGLLVNVMEDDGADSIFMRCALKVLEPRLLRVSTYSMLYIFVLGLLLIILCFAMMNV
jgi:hypothetical protein